MNFEEPDPCELQDELAPGPKEDDTITLNMTISRARMIEAISERAMGTMCRDYDEQSDLKRAVSKHVHAIVQARVEALIGELTEARIRAEFDHLAAEGWDVTDGYGSVKKRMTIREAILAHLTSRKDSYSGTPTRLSEIANEFIANTMKTQLTPEIDALKAQIKNTLNTNVVEAIRTALASAVGLKL